MMKKFLKVSLSRLQMKLVSLSRLRMFAFDSSGSRSGLRCESGELNSQSNWFVMTITNGSLPDLTGGGD
jgi:hypothetical protein